MRYKFCSACMSDLPSNKKRLGNHIRWVTKIQKKKHEIRIQYSLALQIT